MTKNLFDKTETIEDMADYRIANKRDKTNVLFRVCTAVIGRAAVILEFTGALSPDSTGDFGEICTYAGQPFYYNPAEDFYLWWDSPALEWIVSRVKGELGNYWWYSVALLGADYIPQGTATGIGNMHIHS